jgi:hypothetical protein
MYWFRQQANSRSVAGYYKVGAQEIGPRKLSNENRIPMKRIISGALLIVVALVAIIFVADYLIWRYRAATNRNAYGTLTVQYYYAIGEKSGKTEYDFKPPQQETCVSSLFPHSGYSPCWYERKHTEKEIQI